MITTADRCVLDAIREVCLVDNPFAKAHEVASHGLSVPDFEHDVRVELATDRSIPHDGRVGIEGKQLPSMDQLALADGTDLGGEVFTNSSRSL